ncbi:MAG: hypothetical protein KDA81_14220 [Planctomycetaceae bacterium]|nr:hypothetical protein [Planctomycetaceae bacterium]
MLNDFTSPLTFRPAAAESAAGTEQNLPRRVVFFAIVLVPWLTILVSHYVGQGEQATGFIQYDQPYYVANGRAIFERGNGLMYPNPSDPSDDAPVIYFHWLPWIFGALVAPLGAEPGIMNSLVMAAVLPLFGWLTWRLIRERSPQSSPLIFLLAMWGGGVLVIPGLFKGLLRGQTILESVFEFDPTRGLWFLNWGRNVIFASESVYHCIVAAAWLFVLRGQHGRALMAAALAATTHPWTGLELLLMLNAWFFLEAIRFRSGRSITELGTAMLMLCLLLGYYKIWLPGYPSHAALQEHWSLAWVAEWTTILFAYGPVAVVAGLWMKSRHWHPDRSEQFLLTCAAVAFGLAIHDRILPKPVQPLHFTRGYIWMPVFLIAVPQLQSMLTAFQSYPLRHRSLIAAACLTLVMFDNMAFVGAHCYWQFTGTNPECFRLSRDDRAVLEALQTGENPVVFCESLDLSYLMPTYTATRPWLCHKFNTPGYLERQKELLPILANNSVDVSRLPSAIDVLVLKSSRDPSALQQSGDWQKLANENPSWQIWTRRPSEPSSLTQDARQRFTL